MRKAAEHVCTSQVLKYDVIARAVIDNDVKNNVPSPNTINKCVALLKSRYSFKALRCLFFFYNFWICYNTHEWENGCYAKNLCYAGGEIQKKKEVLDISALLSNCPRARQVDMCFLSFSIPKKLVNALRKRV